MLLWRLYQVVMIFMKLIGSRNSVVFSQKLQKRQASSGCPNDEWKFFDGLCYAEIPRRIVFVQARSRCKNKIKGAQLATIRSPEDFKFLKTTFNFTGPLYWVGLSKKRGSWKDELFWEDGSPAVYIPWGPHDPTDNGQENCVVMLSNGVLWDEPCFRTYNALCSIASKSASFGGIAAIAVVVCVLFVLLGFLGYKKFFKKEKNQNYAYSNPYGNSDGSSYGNPYGVSSTTNPQ